MVWLRQLSKRRHNFPAPHGQRIFQLGGGVSRGLQLAVEIGPRHCFSSSFDFFGTFFIVLLVCVGPCRFFDRIYRCRSAPLTARWQSTGAGIPPPAGEGSWRRLYEQALDPDGDFGTPPPPLTRMGKRTMPSTLKITPTYERIIA